MSDSSIPLADVVRALRVQIAEAQAEGADKGVRFELGPIELEFQLVISKDAGAQGGINIGVLSLGGSGKVSQSETHRVKLTLNPVDPEGKDLLLADEQEQRPK